MPETTLENLKRLLDSESQTQALMPLPSDFYSALAAYSQKLRTKKATQQNALPQLLPEERYVCSAEQKFQRRFQTMVEAVSEGQPSFIEFAHLNETRRNVTVRFVKHVNELVGLDMRKYGPFEADDVASIPAASADILIAAGDAVEIYTRDDV